MSKFIIIYKSRNAIRGIFGNAEDSQYRVVDDAKEFRKVIDMLLQHHEILEVFKGIKMEIARSINISEKVETDEEIKKW